MQLIDLLKPIGDELISVRTTAIPVSGSRVIKSDTGVEIEEGFQKFIIPKRFIDTSWKVRWRDTFFRVEGISPSNTPYKLVLICSVEERSIEVVRLGEYLVNYVDEDEELLSVLYSPNDIEITYSRVSDA